MHLSRDVESNEIFEHPAIAGCSPVGIEGAIGP